MQEQVPANVFFGEVGTHHITEITKDAHGWLNCDYDRFNPDGQAWGRRNYKSSCYLSGMAELDPSEYPSNEIGNDQDCFDFYAQYGLDFCGDDWAFAALKRRNIPHFFNNGEMDET